MIYVIEHAECRKCPVCQTHDIKGGFKIVSGEGYWQFRCLEHTNHLLNQVLEASGLPCGQK